MWATRWRPPSGQTGWLYNTPGTDTQLNSQRIAANPFPPAGSAEKPRHLNRLKVNKHTSPTEWFGLLHRRLLFLQELYFIGDYADFLLPLPTFAAHPRSSKQHAERPGYSRRLIGACPPLTFFTKRELCLLTLQHDLCPGIQPNEVDVCITICRPLFLQGPLVSQISQMDGKDYIVD